MLRTMYLVFQQGLAKILTIAKEKKLVKACLHALHVNLTDFLTKDLKFKFSADFRFLLKLAGIPCYLIF